MKQKTFNNITASNDAEILNNKMLLSKYKELKYKEAEFLITEKVMLIY